MLVPLLSPPQVWQQLKGLLCCYTDMHLHLETQHVVFLQCVQPDLRMEHTHKHTRVWTWSLPLLLCPRYCQQAHIFNRMTPDSTHSGMDFPCLVPRSSKITPGGWQRCRNSKQRFLTYSVLLHGSPPYGLWTHQNKQWNDNSCVCLTCHIRDDHQTQHLHCFSQKLIPSWFWHPLASALRHYCSSGTSGKQMAASALECSCNIQ